jgi:hypothetical protein
MVCRGRGALTRAVAELPRSEPTAGEFARRRGLSVRMLRWWRWKLKREKPVLPALLPVRVVEHVTAAMEGQPPRPDPGLEAGLPSGVRLRVTPAARPAYVAELVAQLLARCAW